MPQEWNHPEALPSLSSSSPGWVAAGDGNWVSEIHVILLALNMEDVFVRAYEGNRDLFLNEIHRMCGRRQSENITVSGGTKYETLRIWDDKGLRITLFYLKVIPSRSLHHTIAENKPEIGIKLVLIDLQKKCKTKKPTDWKKKSMSRLKIAK